MTAGASRIAIDEALALTRRLVAIRSYPGEELAVQQDVAAWFAEQGMIAEISPTSDPARPNVIVRIENGPGPVFLLNGHTDTVLADSKWEHDPWQGWIDGDRFRGLGAVDMKSGVAAAMLVTRALHRELDLWSGTLIFSSVVDEEAYSLGARALIDDGIAADYCLVTESGFDWPCLGAYGKYLVRVDVTGQAAHASWPEQGINAAEEAAKFVARLDEIELPAHPRIRSSQTVLSFLSGSATYVITLPEQATVLINRHTIPGETEDGVLAQYRELAERIGSAATFTISTDPPRYPSWEISDDHPYVRTFAQVYKSAIGKVPEFAWRGYGDMNLFSTDAGIPTIMFGPRGDGFHNAGEYVEIPSIAASADIIIELIATLLPPAV